MDSSCIGDIAAFYHAFRTCNAECDAVDWGNMLRGLVAHIWIIGSVHIAAVVAIEHARARTEGVIIGAEPDATGSGIHWWPRVAFDTLDGEKIEFVADVAWNTPPEIGCKVQR